MQAAMDSFLVTLRQRLAALNPAREAVVNGASRPGVVALHNEVEARQESGMFYLRWLGVREREAWLAMDCEITYQASGSEERNGADAARELARMEAELLAILEPPRAEMADYTDAVPVAIDSRLFWSGVEFAAVERAGGALRRTVKLTVFNSVECTLREVGR